MKNIAIIYHDADFDGKLSNEVCRFHLKRLYPDANVHSYGWDYGRPVPLPDVGPPEEGTCHPDDPRAATGQLLEWRFWDAIYIVDLSVDELMAQPELRDNIVWIDHHESAIEKWDATPSDAEPEPGRFTGYRYNGVAACRLCWQWFTFDKGPNGDPRTFPVDMYLPTPQDFIDRQVVEPELIRLAGEYDIWDHRDPDAKALQFGLRTLDKQGFDCLVHYQFACGPAEQVDALYLKPVIKTGHAIKSYCDKQNDEYSATFSHTIQFEGLTFCALNIGQRGNSDLVRGGLKLEHQAIFAWRYTGKEVLVSLYHAPGHETRDLSTIAVKYGGGGHRGACGFRITLVQLDAILASLK